MINLVKKAELNGRIYTQLEQTDKAYLYEVKLPKGHISGDHIRKVDRIHYEVFKSTEIYPQTEAFGDWAWCFRLKNDEESKQAAYKKFKSIHQ